MTLKEHFKSHFTTDKKGIHQVDRISEFLEKSGSRGFLAVELRMGGGHSRQAYLVPWAVVQKQYQEAIKIPVELIKRHIQLQRRGKTYNIKHLYTPLKREIDNGT
jgi:hypothetical protein